MIEVEKVEELFEVLDTIQFSETGYYTIFKVMGKLYRLWYYTDSPKKWLQELVEEDDDIVPYEVCSFE